MSYSISRQDNFNKKDLSIHELKGGVAYRRDDGTILVRDGEYFITFDRNKNGRIEMVHSKCLQYSKEYVEVSLEIIIKD